MQEFKYLLNKPINTLLDSSQFLSILAAETDHLVSVDIHLMEPALAQLRERLSEICLLGDVSETAQAWNGIRKAVLDDALDSHLLVEGARWARVWLKEEEEDWVGERCRANLESVSTCCLPFLGVVVPTGICL